MPNKYSQNSQDNLDSCHWKLRPIFIEALQVMDNAILEGHRGQERQDELFANGKSRVGFPYSKHNTIPSEAVDAIPSPVDWEDERRMIYFAGIVKGIAHRRGVKIRWGGDWDQDTQVKDNKFNDLVHFELIGD